MNAELAKQYREAKRRLQLDIDALYTRYMNKFGVSYDQAVKDLTYKEQTDWLEGFRERAEQIAAKAPGYEKLIREQTEQSFGTRISRLEARQAEIDLEVSKLGIGAQQTLSEGLTDIYEDGFYKSSFSLQQESGIGFDIEQLDSGTVQDMIEYPWSGASFSERIWRNTEQLKTELKNTLTQGLIRGDSADEMARKLAKRMDVSFSAAKRLVLTESAHIHNQAKLDAYKEADIEKYQLIATLDKRTSEICREMDGKTFKVKDARAGENYPPFHPYCRTTTKAVFEGTETGERAARDKDGKTAYVPADMTYNEWEKKYIQSNQYIKSDDVSWIGGTNIPEDVRQSIESIKKRIEDDIPELKGFVNEIIIADLDAPAMASLRVPEKGDDLDAKLYLDRKFWSSGYDKIQKRFLETRHIVTNDPFSIIAHEMGHFSHHLAAFKRIDYAEGMTRKQIAIQFKQEINNVIQEAFVAAFTDESYNEIIERIVNELGAIPAENFEEWIADCFGSYYAEDHDSGIAQKVVEYIKDILEE